MTAPDPALEAKADALATAVEAALPGWVVRSVERLLVAFAGDADPAVVDEARAAGHVAQAEVGARLRALLGADIDEQRANPLSLLRAAVVHPTAVLHRAGVPPVVRDDFAEANFPDDVYDLTPASFADLDPSLHEPGIEWGVAKAWAHKQRHSRPSTEGAT
ncbi:MAG: hypothetical protein ACR2MO_11665 [Acidimicrobiales bacterium]